MYKFLPLLSLIVLASCCPHQADKYSDFSFQKFSKENEERRKQHINKKIIPYILEVKEEKYDSHVNQ
jgi:hypothetical protein